MTTGDSLSVRTKFCFLTWIGEKGGPLAKARAGPNKRILQQVITVSQFITSYIILVQSLLITRTKPRDRRWGEGCVDILISL